MNIKAIVNGKLIMTDRVIYDSVIIFDTKIRKIVSNDNFVEYKKNHKEKMQIIDAKGRYVSPGFIDIHIHGCGGYRYYGCDDGSFKSYKHYHSRKRSNSIFAYYNDYGYHQYI